MKLVAAILLITFGIITSVTNFAVSIIMSAIGVLLIIAGSELLGSYL